MSIFGPQITGASRPDSDLDVLLEFEPSQQPGLPGLSRMAAELTAMADGRRVGGEIHFKPPQRRSRIRSDAPLSAIVDMRHGLDHGYFDIDAVLEPMACFLIMVIPTASHHTMAPTPKR
jgi:predicted nucleotidyltransferase